jgi:S1-C subfamily serine protease
MMRRGHPRRHATAFRRKNMKEAKAVKERSARQPGVSGRALVAAALLGGALTFGAVTGSGAIAQPLGSQVQRPNAPVSFAPIVKQVRPAVVSVKAKAGGDEISQSSLQQREFRNWQDNFNIPEWFRDMFPDRSVPDPFHSPRRPGRRSLAQGSGFIISEDGYVVTNNHVVDNAAEVELVLDDGKSYDAKIIGTDKKTDLALLKIDADRTFPYVAFTGKDIEIGDWVLAVGNPFGLGGSVTVGVVSARGRDIGAGLYDDFIQIDAPINKGNSGGPTFNLDGEVVGINTAIFSPSGGSVGIGFAIPAGVAKDVIDQLRESGSVTRGWLGVQIQPVTRDIADLDQKNQQAIKAIAELKDVEREVGMLREKLDSTFQHISVGPESLTFRRDVVTIGKQTGVSIRLWNPQKTILNAEASDTALTIILRVEGSFHGTVQFLEEVLRLPWIQTVNPLMLISKPNTGNVSLVTTDFTIKGLQPQRLLPMKDRLKT